jgi:hypothetical protein
MKNAGHHDGGKEAEFVQLMVEYKFWGIGSLKISPTGCPASSYGCG